MKTYPGDLTDNQWQVIKELLEIGRMRGHELRDIMNAILYFSKSGCQWRMLAGEFVPLSNRLLLFQAVEIQWDFGGNP